MRHAADLELVHRHAAGDPTAFEEIFDSYQGMIYNLALRYTGDPDRAEDLAQEALLKIARNLQSFHGKSSLKTWIYQVAANCFRSRLRRKRLDTRSFDRQDGVPEARDDRAGPEDRAYGSELQGKLSEALADLPMAFREAVVLRDVEGLSYAEIARVAGCRLGTVRSRIARGREALRQALSEQEAQP